MVPKTCEMPDLSVLDSRLARFLITAVLAGDPGLSPKEGLYRRNFVRLVDQAVKEYEDARIALIELIGISGNEFLTGGWELFFRFVRHLENCINATNRAIRTMERIKSEPGSLAVPKIARRLIKSISDDIRELRDAIEHMDEIIQKDGLTGEQPVMLGIGEPGDRLILARYYVRFADLATTLRKLNEVAHLLVQV